MKSRQSVLQGDGLGAVMRQCGLRVLLVPVIIVVIVGAFLAAPTAFAALEFVWYGWAMILTHNYTSVVPAVVTEWTAVLLFIWAICVACKLSKSNEGLSLLFGLLAVVIFLLGVEPANCALYALVSDWTLDGRTGWDVAAILTTWLSLGLVCVAAIVGVLSVFAVSVTMS